MNHDLRYDGANTWACRRCAFACAGSSGNHVQGPTIDGCPSPGFDKLMAEEWSIASVDADSQEHYLRWARVSVGRDTLLVSTDEGNATCAAIAVLGKRALALLLAADVAPGDFDDYFDGGPGTAEWGAIIAEAKKLREGA